MASVDGISDFITTLRVHMHVPIAASDERRDEKERAWMASMAQCLRTYDDDVLKTGAQAILRDARGSDRRFPLPGQIIKALNEIVEDRNRKPMLAAQFDETRSSPSSRDRIRLVVDLLRSSAIGRRAASENWLGGLVDFCRVHARLPDEKEVRRIQDKSREFDETRDMCHAAVGWPSTPAGQAHAAVCAKWADTIEARSQLWARVLRGEEDEAALFRPLDMTAGNA